MGYISLVARFIDGEMRRIRGKAPDPLELRYGAVGKKSRGRQL
jgi:hypothetical protein